MYSFVLNKKEKVNEGHLMMKKPFFFFWLEGHITLFKLKQFLDYAVIDLIM